MSDIIGDVNKALCKRRHLKSKMSQIAPHLAFAKQALVIEQKNITYSWSVERRKYETRERCQCAGEQEGNDCL